MIIYGPSEHPVVKEVIVVGPLAAQIVHPVVAGVVLVEEEGHVPDGIAVPSAEAGRREAHGDDAIRHVGQVKVDAVTLEATFVLKLRTRLSAYCTGELAE